MNKDPFRPLEEDEELLGPEILYLSVIGALIYLANANKGGADHIGCADAGYLSDPHKVRSQIGYVFTCRGTVILWRFTKQYTDATFSNHIEIIVIHEASRECIWLRSVVHFIREKYELECDKKSTILCENNATRIAQLNG